MDLHLSSTSNQVLQLFTQDNKPLYINEIVRKLHAYPNTIQRALKTLEHQNLVKSTLQGNRRFYSLNTKNSLLHDIQSFIVPKTNSIPKQVYKYQKWVNRECSVALNTAVGSAQANSKYMKKVRVDPVEFIWYNAVTGGVYHATDQLVRTGNRIAEEIKKDPSFAQQLAENCLVDGERLVSAVKTFQNIDLHELTDQQLYEEFNKLHELLLEFIPYIVIPAAIEKTMIAELREQVANPADVDLLIEPVSVLSDEQIDELLLAAEVKKTGWTQESTKKLHELTEKYCWLPMMALHHKPFDIVHFKNIIDELILTVENPGKELEMLRGKEQQRSEELEEILKKVEANEILRALVRTTQAYINLRTYRFNVIKQFHYYHLPLLYEIAQRVGIPKEDIAYLTYPEVLDFLKRKEKKDSYVSLIAERKTGFANLTWKGKSTIISGIKNIIKTIEQYNIVAAAPMMKKEVQGNPAFQGLVTGKVKIVKRLSELDKVQKGDVLVAKMTTPDYIMAMHRAAAIITDEGGITCHAAIVSREFRIPCIVGTKNATQVLQDGDIVEVNAHTGIARVVEFAEASEDTKRLYGKTIYKGKVEGTARIILDASDFDKLVPGDIVIAAQTTPDYLSLLYRAKGFIVDEESFTSHAVLYGRALEIPSIMGTAVARSIIKDGEHIELDATNGVVRRLD